jgi:hypothetical protein
VVGGCRTVGSRVVADYFVNSHRLARALPLTPEYLANPAPPKNQINSDAEPAFSPTNVDRAKMVSILFPSMVRRGCRLERAGAPAFRGWAPSAPVEWTGLALGTKDQALVPVLWYAEA